MGMGLCLGRNFSNVTNDHFFVAIGFQRLAPYRFDVEPALFVSVNGDVSVRFTSLYDFLLTQHVIWQPRFWINVARREVRKYGWGKGMNDIQLCLR